MRSLETNDIIVDDARLTAEQIELLPIEVSSAIEQRFYDSDLSAGANCHGCFPQSQGQFRVPTAQIHTCCTITIEDWFGFW